MWPLILRVFSHSFSSPRFCSRVSAIVSASLLLALYLTLPPHTWSRSPVLYTPAPLPYVTRNVLLLSHQHCSFLFLLFPLSSLLPFLSHFWTVLYVVLSRRMVAVYRYCWNVISSHFFAVCVVISIRYTRLSFSLWPPLFPLGFYYCGGWKTPGKEIRSSYASENWHYPLYCIALYRLLSFCVLF